MKTKFIDKFKVVPFSQNLGKMLIFICICFFVNQFHKTVFFFSKNL